MAQPRAGEAGDAGLRLYQDPELLRAYLLPHPSDAVLRVRHRYPVAPWDWHAVTPDLVYSGTR